MIIKSLFLISSILFLTVTVFAQSGDSLSPAPTSADTSKLVSDSTKTPPKKSGSYVTIADEMPEPIGGMRAILEKVVYPLWDQTRNISGKVYVLAVIDEEGNVEKTEILVGINKSLNKAAMDAVKATKFTPGKLHGKPVKVQVSIPIVFTLR